MKSRSRICLGKSRFEENKVPKQGVGTRGFLQAGKGGTLISTWVFRKAPNKGLESQTREERTKGPVLTSSIQHP